MRGGASSAHSRASGNPEEDSVIAMETGIPLARGRADHPISLADVTLLADPAGALYWPDEKLLVVADLHLEKGSAFAERGVLLPPYDTAATLARLARLIERYAPRLVIALGDSFHDERRAFAHGRRRPRRAQGAPARPRLDLDRRQSRSRSSRRHRRRFRRCVGARAADVSPRAVRTSRATAKSPAICIRWRAWPARTRP